MMVAVMFFFFFCECAVRHSVYILCLGVIGRLSSVIVALTGRPLHYSTT